MTSLKKKLIFFSFTILSLFDNAQSYNFSNTLRVTHLFKCFEACRRLLWFLCAPSFQPPKSATRFMMLKRKAEQFQHKCRQRSFGVLTVNIEVRENLLSGTVEPEFFFRSHRWQFILFTFFCRLLPVEGWCFAAVAASCTMVLSQYCRRLSLLLALQLPSVRRQQCFALC